MQLSQSEADVYVPDGQPVATALSRLTHLAIGAHADDIEIIAHSAIVDCIENSDTKAFGGIVVTDGAGSARTGPYADKSDTEMKVIRRDEQRRAAELGRYAIQLQLAHPSIHVKSAQAGASVVADLAAVFAVATPEVVYLHNPADKHDTHIGVLSRCLTALRALPAERRPKRVLGVEGWRGLDWMLTADKVALDDGGHPELRRELLTVFDSQITGGKRYDEAVEGRRAANATFHDSHAVDTTDRLTWAMDLTPLINDPALGMADYVGACLDRLRADVMDRIARMQ